MNRLAGLAASSTMIIVACTSGHARVAPVASAQVRQSETLRPTPGRLLVRILDDTDGSVLVASKVVVVDAPLKLQQLTMSDNAGIARIDSLPSGTWVLRILRIGYVTRVDTVTYDARVGAAVNIRMKREVIHLTEVGTGDPIYYDVKFRVRRAAGDSLFWRLDVYAFDDNGNVERGEAVGNRDSMVGDVLVKVGPGTYRFSIVAQGFHPLFLPPLVVNRNLERDVRLQRAY